jgi:hypothetical protein
MELRVRLDITTMAPKVSMNPARIDSKIQDHPKR